MREKVPILSSKSNVSLMECLSSSKWVIKPTSARWGDNQKICLTFRFKPTFISKRFWLKHEHFILALFVPLVFKLVFSEAFTRVQKGANRIIFGIGKRAYAMKKNEIEYNSPGALNVDGWGIFVLSSTFNPAQWEVRISKTLADEIAQNVQRAAQEFIDTNLNPTYKLGEATTVGIDGVIGSATTDYAKSPNNSLRHSIFKSTVKGNKYAFLGASAADLTAPKLQGLAQVTKDVFISASKEGYRGDDKEGDKRNSE